MFWKGRATDPAPKVKVTEITNTPDGGSRFEDRGSLLFERIVGDTIVGLEEIHGWKNSDISADSCFVQLTVAGGKQGFHVCAIPRIAVLILEGEQKITCTTNESRVFRSPSLMLFTDDAGKGHAVEFIKGGVSIIWTNPILPPLLEE